MCSSSRSTYISKALSVLSAPRSDTCLFSWSDHFPLEHASSPECTQAPALFLWVSSPEAQTKSSLQACAMCWEGDCVFSPHGQRQCQDDDVTSKFPDCSCLEASGGSAQWQVQLAAPRYPESGTFSAGHKLEPVCVTAQHKCCGLTPADNKVPHSPSMPPPSSGMGRGIRKKLIKQTNKTQKFVS